MPAGIVEGAQAAVAVAHHQHRILADLHRQVVAGIQHLAIVTHEQPIAVPDHVQIDLVILRARNRSRVPRRSRGSVPADDSAWCRAQSWWFPENPGRAYDSNIPLQPQCPEATFIAKFTTARFAGAAGVRKLAGHGGLTRRTSAPPYCADGLLGARRGVHALEWCAEFQPHIPAGCRPAAAAGGIDRTAGLPGRARLLRHARSSAGSDGGLAGTHLDPLRVLPSYRIGEAGWHPGCHRGRARLPRHRVPRRLSGVVQAAAAAARLRVDGQSRHRAIRGHRLPRTANADEVDRGDDRRLRPVSWATARRLYSTAYAGGRSGGDSRGARHFAASICTAIHTALISNRYLPFVTRIPCAPSCSTAPIR